ncbi:hypothetical protein [Paenibacillus macerans]|uniref:hypothetical protein n=1 Tax=Paenibacillus macerans TaxID=44252 RepID=UPI000F5635A1|nr:hypothetical protein [Paenibacillus macerans]
MALLWSSIRQCGHCGVIYFSALGDVTGGDVVYFGVTGGGVTGGGAAGGGVTCDGATGGGAAGGGVISPNAKVHAIFVELPRNGWFKCKCAVHFQS